MDAQVVSNILPVASVVGITIGIVQVIKNVDDQDRLNRFYPLFALIIGTVLSFFAFHLDLLTSIITALSASGTFDLGRRTVLNQK